MLRLSDQLYWLHTESSDLKESALRIMLLKLGGRWICKPCQYPPSCNLFHQEGRSFEVFICSFLSFFNQLTYVWVYSIFIQPFLPESLTVFLNAFPCCLGYTKYHSPYVLKSIPPTCASWIEMCILFFSFVKQSVLSKIT